MNELISVIVPIYNVEKYLPKCIESIQRQTYQNLEIILVDDGSCDRCPGICDKFAKDDSRIKVIHKKNGGLSDARNMGIEVANGKYLAFVDSDDYISQDMIKKLYCAIIRDNSDMAICNIEYIDENNNPLNSNAIHVLDMTVEELGFWTKLYEGYYTYCVVAWNKLYSKNLFVNTRYDVGKLHEDEFIIHKLVSKCKKISFLSEKLYYYLQREQSITRSEYTIKRMDAAEALICRSIYFWQRGWQYFAELALTRSIGFIMKGYNMPEHSEECWKLRIEELHKIFREAYTKIASSKTASLRFRVNAFTFYLSPFAYKVTHTVNQNNAKR